MERFKKVELGPDTYDKKLKTMLVIANITRPIIKPIMLVILLPIRLWVALNDWVFDGRILTYFGKE